MEHKVFVLVDEGSKSLYFHSMFVAEGSYGTHALFTYTQLRIAPLPFSQCLQLCLHHLCCLHTVADANDLWLTIDSVQCYMLPAAILQTDD